MDTVWERYRRGIRPTRNLFGIRYGGMSYRGRGGGVIFNLSACAPLAATPLPLYEHIFHLTLYESTNVLENHRAKRPQKLLLL